MIKVSERIRKGGEAKTRFHLGVSMGSGHHQSEALEAMVGWINARGFEAGRIDISDTLNRHNHMRDGLGEDEAWLLTRRQGDEWKSRNASILARLEMPVELIHWEHWLRDERFARYFLSFRHAARRDPGFRTALMQDIQLFYQRRFGQDLHERSAGDIEHSMNFYLEELAVLSIQFEDYPCLEIYPGRELDSLKLVRAGKVANVPAGTANAVYGSLFLHEDTPLRRAG